MYTNKAPKYKYICVYTLHTRAPQNTPRPHVYIQRPESPFYKYTNNTQTYTQLSIHMSLRAARH